MVRRALASVHHPLVVAADGGARVARYFDLAVSIVIGDLDSLDTDEVDMLRAQRVQIQQHPVEKDETDLELALKWTAQQGARWIRVVGGVGDRLDQTLGNVYLLALAELVTLDVRLLAGKQEAWLLRPGTHSIHGAAGDTLSLIPLGGAVSGVRTEQLYYPLHDETLIFGPARGMSNQMVADTAQVSLNEGLLLAVHTVGKG